MKIVKYIKKKKSIYQVVFEKEMIDIYEDILVQFGLLFKKEITDQEFQEIQRENHQYRCYEEALRYLGKKMRSTKEMKDYLKKHEYSHEIIQMTIKKLKEAHYLDDQKYLQAFLNDQLKFSLDGPLKLKKKLKEKGIEESLIDEALNLIDEAIWQEKIQKIIQKKVQANHRDSQQKLKQRVSSYLLSNGFYREQIELEIQQIQVKNELELLEKEEEKIRKRLSRKYDGEALEFQVKQKLYQKGFRKE